MQANGGSDDNAQNHRDAVELMIQHLGFTHDEITQSLQSNVYDQVAATYYLLRDSPKLNVYRMYLLMPNGSATPSPAAAEAHAGDSTPRTLARRLSRALSIGSSSTPASNPPSAPGTYAPGYGSVSRPVGVVGIVTLHRICL
jgi:hypothetical protein